MKTKKIRKKKEDKKESVITFIPEIFGLIIRFFKNILS
ncbi:hypothetical protein ACUXGO_002531 [Staphylococcus cohnii]